MSRAPNVVVRLSTDTTSAELTLLDRLYAVAPDARPVESWESESGRFLRGLGAGPDDPGVDPRTRASEQPPGARP